MMSAKPAQHRLRELLLHVLRTDADFEAFVMDRHKAVAQRFSAGQERTQKTNLLLWHVAGLEILHELKASWPQAVASFELQDGLIGTTDFLDRLRFEHSGSWVRTQTMMFGLGACLVAGLWLMLHAITEAPTQARSDAGPPHQALPRAAVPATTQSAQTLPSVLGDAKVRPAANVRLAVLGRHVEKQREKDCQSQPAPVPEQSAKSAKITSNPPPEVDILSPKAYVEASNRYCERGRGYYAELATLGLSPCVPLPWINPSSNCSCTVGTIGKRCMLSGFSDVVGGAHLGGNAEQVRNEYREYGFDTCQKMLKGCRQTKDENEHYVCFCCPE